MQKEVIASGMGEGTSRIHQHLGEKKENCGSTDIVRKGCHGKELRFWSQMDLDSNPALASHWLLWTSQLMIINEFYKALMICWALLYVLYMY